MSVHAPPQSLLDLSKLELLTLLTDWNEPPFRAAQIWGWLYHRSVCNPVEMSDLPKSLRTRLAETFPCQPLRPVTTWISADQQTQKTLFALSDGAQIESVLMCYRRRHTVCVSTQAGCAMGCPFCATGQGGFQRNLTAGEIVAQVLFYASKLAAGNQGVTNVVFMGMGEPLANYPATWAAVRRLNDPDGFRLAARAMTISTVGLVPGIRRMAGEPEQVGLSVSLHAPTDARRDQLAPINRRFPLPKLLDACKYYVKLTHRRISFEYVLIDQVNDTPQHAVQLADLLTGMLAQVNLIPLNPTLGSEFRPSPAARVRAFQEVLRARGLVTTVRLRRGTDIQASCGQLGARSGPATMQAGAKTDE